MATMAPRDAWKRRLTPFGDIYNEMYKATVTRLEGMATTDLRQLIDDVKISTGASVWYAIAEMRGLIDLEAKRIIRGRGEFVIAPPEPPKVKVVKPPRVRIAKPVPVRRNKKRTPCPRCGRRVKGLTAHLGWCQNSATAKDDIPAETEAL